MPQNEKGVGQAVAAFYRNDPYFPRPGRSDTRDQALWKEFRSRFLTASGAILEGPSQEASLPELWIEMVEQRE